MANCDQMLFPHTFSSLVPSRVPDWLSHFATTAAQANGFSAYCGSWLWGWISRTILDLWSQRILCRCNLLAQDCTMNANDCVCQNCNPLIELGIIFLDGILISFPMAVIMHFPRNLVIIIVFLYLDFHQKDSEVWRRLFALFCRFVFHWESTHSRR